MQAVNQTQQHWDGTGAGQHVGQQEDLQEREQREGGEKHVRQREDLAREEGKKQASEWEVWLRELETEEMSPPTAHPPTL